MTESELPPEGYETCELCGCFKTDLHAQICTGKPPEPFGAPAVTMNLKTAVDYINPVKPRREAMACGSCAWYSPSEIMPHQIRCRECGADDGEPHRLMYVRDSLDRPIVRKCYIGQGQKEFKMIRVGTCRHHSPTESGFPVVRATDWCGDHKLDKEAL